MPTQATVLARIRSLVNEGTARFFSDLELMGWYSDGAAQQHLVAVEMARTTGRLQDVLPHTYFKRFAKSVHINVVAGTSLYAMPTDFLREFQVSFTDASNIEEKDAAEQIGQDWFTKNLPHLQPTFARPSYNWRVNETTQLPALELSVFGNKGVPNAPGVLRIYYYRDVERITAYSSGTNVDLHDPYNEGPQWYARGQAAIKRGEDPSGYLQLAASCSQNILAPMTSSSALAAHAQGAGSVQQVAAGASRDAR